MFPFHRIAHQSLTHFAVALVAAGSWLSGCGSDDDDDGGDGSGAKGGSAGSVTGGTAGTGGTPTGGTAGTPSGGTAGTTPTGGTGGATGGTAGTGTGGDGMGGDGAGGDDGMGGQGMGGDDGMGGQGVGGEGGSSEAMCTTANLTVTQVSAMPMQQHNHLPINGTFRTTLLGMINTGAPLVFTLPTDGSNAHNHTLTFTAQQLTTLKTGGTLAMNVTSSTNGPQNNQHTHTYRLDCAP